jgi:hypothetical protein
VVLELDRCLRFFFLCTVLNADVKVEETPIARAYYYYVCVLAEPGMRTELQSYVRKYYKRFHQWMNKHRECLKGYREKGEWDPKLVAELDEAFLA